ncbi:hypothetical protein K438DRAFT_1790921 [Mycena galopus ATCC 62051]|nr:hypothetical protein K438DRAFT_1790921 [Mycena galopus ATCC 62051]
MDSVHYAKWQKTPHLGQSANSLSFYGAGLLLYTVPRPHLSRIIAIVLGQSQKGPSCAGDESMHNRRQTGRDGVDANLPIPTCRDVTPFDGLKIFVWHNATDHATDHAMDRGNPNSQMLSDSSNKMAGLK